MNMNDATCLLCDGPARTKDTDLGREIEAAENRMTPDFEYRLAHLIKLEKQARAEYDAVRDGWHETISVKPIQ
ncbi:hypothetical protein AB595_10215 [Massilia sp. WF1]|uniref:hypothetical protein n=1 Tax=unclassified Massilia TaxID=2609279 RepID=UPI000649EDC6|nr:MULTISPECIES: hypothetical protein [unclassified Massilia]ALK99959.1 hypothetical protein AM586_27320 [Massilia sp. WG5]KLU36799.1 hypothetical protein AB595_10215 [Massilia sp. WF1]